MRGGRRVVAGVVLLAGATGVGLFVAVWALGDGGTDDEAGSTTTEARSTTTVIDSVDALAAAVGCDDVGGFGGVLAVEGSVDSGACARAGDSQAAGLHVAADDEVRDEVLAYLEEHSGSWSGFVTCDGETPDQVAARVAFAVVAGPGWLVTTRYAEVRDAAVAAGGQEVSSARWPRSRPRATSSAGRRAAGHRRSSRGEPQPGVMRMIRSPEPFEVPM